MEANGQSRYTIRETRKELSYLEKHANLNNPETVKQFIAQKQCSTSFKRMLCIAYQRYTKYYNIQWEKPHYTQTAKAIKIPSQEAIKMLIAGAKSPLSIKLQISMETGLRPIEIFSLKANDLDADKKLLYPTTAKHGASRTLKITNELKELLQKYITEHKLNPTDKLFNGNAEEYSKHFRAMRNRLANKLQKPELRNIRLYDLRHFFATMLYAKTRDLLYVKQQMGHKHIDTTLIYTQLLNLTEDEWTCKATTNTNEAQQLIESGFEYVTTTPDNLMLFKKRKT
jgi:integrase